MATKRTLLKDLKVIRKNEKKEEIKQACIEVLFPQQATLKECKLLIEKNFSVKLSNKEFSKWRKEYEATNANQSSSDAYHILVPNENKKEDEELSNGTNNQE